MEKRRSVSRATHKPVSQSGHLSVYWTGKNTLKGGKMKLEKPQQGSRATVSFMEVFVCAREGQMNEFTQQYTYKPSRGHCFLS